jgi:hypothetical protein
MNEIVLPTVGQRKVTMENTTKKKKKNMILFNTYLFNLVLELFPSFVFGKSTALGEEIEAKQKELKKQLEELKENKEERKKVDEQNSIEGDTDSPNEANSAEELQQWDELIAHGKKTIVDLINWLAN